MTVLSPEALSLLLRYDPETGKLFWLARDASISKDWRRWNSRYAGKEALTTVNNHGYRTGIVVRKSISAHRVIWALVYGEWPIQIDHINGLRNDNRLINLRNVSHAENQKNKRVAKNSKSGVTGVFWNRRRNEWVSQINIEGTQTTLGYFKTKTDAVVVRRAAEIRYGYKPDFRSEL